MAVAKPVAFNSYDYHESKYSYILNGLYLRSLRSISNDFPGIAALRNENSIVQHCCNESNIAK